MLSEPSNLYHVSGSNGVQVEHRRIQYEKFNKAVTLQIDVDRTAETEHDVGNNVEHNGVHIRNNDSDNEPKFHT